MGGGTETETKESRASASDEAEALVSSPLSPLRCDVYTVSNKTRTRTGIKWCFDDFARETSKRRLAPKGKSIYYFIFL